MSSVVTRKRRRDELQKAAEPVVPVDEAEEYEVEDIVDHRFDEDLLFYLIKWKGYKDCTWVHETNTNNCFDMVNKYWMKVHRERASAQACDNPYVVGQTVNASSFVGKRRLSVELNLPAVRQLYKERLMMWQADLNEASQLAMEPFVNVENTVDYCDIPVFDYIVRHRLTGDTSRLNIFTPITWCKCKEKTCGVDRNCCSAKNNNKKCAYTSDGRLINNEPTDRDPIYECNMGCSCPRNCRNRVVQKGRPYPMCIFRTKNRGWGARTLETIPKNSFVSEYLGELVTLEEADRRDSSYLFELDLDGEPLYAVDAEHMGNLSHFFNHSCEPNLRVRSVYVECVDEKVPHLAFFATRTIAKNEELTIDYNPRALNSARGRGRGAGRKEKCFCGAPNCRKVLWS